MAVLDIGTDAMKCGKAYQNAPVRIYIGTWFTTVIVKKVILPVYNVLMTVKLYPLDTRHR